MNTNLYLLAYMYTMTNAFVIHPGYTLRTSLSNRKYNKPYIYVKFFSFKKYFIFTKNLYNIYSQFLL